jgi:AcrR family transcriptional regulator
MIEKKDKRFERDPEDKKGRIIKAFLDLVDKKGYENVSINDIPEKAGVSIGTIYYHFEGGKPAIIKASFNFLADAFVDYDAISQMTSENFEENFSQYLRYYIQSHREQARYHKAIDQATLSNQELFDDMGFLINNYMTEVAKNMRKVNEIYAEMEESKLRDMLILQFNVIEALIHRHLFFTPLFDKDEELISFLTKIIESIMTSSI